MAIPIPLLLAGAGILSSLLKSQEYYPAAEAPTKTQIWGDVLGSGLSGYLGGNILGPLGGAAGAGAPDPTAGAAGAGAPLVAGGGVSEQDRAMLDFLTGGGFAGGGMGGGGGGGGLNSILALLGQQAMTPAAARAPDTLVPSGILSGVR